MLAAGALVAALALPARADDYFSQEEEITFEIDRSRSRGERITVASLLGGAVVAGGVGVLFTLDAADKADEVSATGKHSGLVYTPEREETRRDAIRSRRFAIAGYAVGGGLLVAGITAFILTDPGTETMLVSSRTALVPTDGGFFAARSWSF